MIKTVPGSLSYLGIVATSVSLISIVSILHVQEDYNPNYILVAEMLQVIVEKDQRVPADLVLLRTTERSGACFVRTDQLDGETDWKLRLAVPATQKLESDLQLFDIRASLFVEKPQRDIHSFIGTFTRVCKIF